jgi:hypothetical protein
MDPRIRIRIHPKMSWIRNTAFFGYLIGQTVVGGKKATELL